MLPYLIFECFSCFIFLDLLIASLFYGSILFAKLMQEILPHILLAIMMPLWMLYAILAGLFGFKIFFQSKYICSHLSWSKLFNDWIKTIYWFKLCILFSAINVYFILVMLSLYESIKTSSHQILPTSVGSILVTKL